MSQRTCFVIMPIGDQEYPGASITAAELKSKYSDLIKEAILNADPNLEVVRADEVAVPGTVTGDIITRLMHSDFVVADVTYPNANVFYELGLRHACRMGTVIIRDKSGPKIPFDIAHLRYIEYQNTATGLKQLSSQLRQYFDHLRRNPDSPDNQFQEYAKLTHFQFPNYSPEEEDPETAAMMTVFQSPEVLELLMRTTRGEEINQNDFTKAVFSNPALAQQLMVYLVKSGQLSAAPQKNSQRPPNQGRKRK